MVNVIIVEDDPMVGSINRKYTEKIENMKVIAVFRSGQEVLDFLAHEMVDLVILDLYMPGMNGLELLHKIRENRFSVEVIMVTAASDAESVKEAMNCGILDYLVKPFTFDRFRQAIEKYKRRHSIFENAKDLSQNEIDRIVAASQMPRKAPSVYEKGINSRTLEELMNHLIAARPDSLTSEELAGISGFSMVTVRRYMNYLVDHDLADSFIDYRTGGRPSVHYKAR
ncbi:MAG: response regulator [Solobacterium sp.]|nr:response regulator [Solobacterium sp.]